MQGAAVQDSNGYYQNGRAVTFAIAGDKIEIPGLKITKGSMSFSAWINKPGSGGNRTIMTNRGDANLAGSRRFFVHSSEAGRFQVTNDAGSVFNANTATLTVGKVHHLFGELDLDAMEIRIYLDNVLAQTTAITGDFTIASNIPLAIGGRPQNTGEFFIGTIDECMYFNRLLTTPEREFLYTNADSINSYSDLSVWWKLDEKSGTNVVDSGPDASHGTSDGVTFIVGTINGAYEFGVDSVNVAGAIPDEAPWSISTWVRSASYQVDNYAWALDGPNVLGLDPFESASGTIGCRAWSQETFSYFLNAAGLALDTWVNVVITSNGTNLHTMWIAGTLVDTSTDTVTLTGMTGLALGEFGGGFQLAHDQDDFRLYNKELDTDEIGALSRMVPATQVPVAVNPAQLWTPEGIFTRAWWDASDKETLTEAGNSVSRIADKSGVGNHLVQPTGGLQPTTNANTLNGLNVVSGDGSEWMNSETIVTEADGDFRVYGIFNNLSCDNNADSIYSLNTTAPDFNFLSDDGGGPEFLAGLNGAFGPNIDPTGTPFNGPSIYMLDFDFNGAGTVRVIIDGIVRGSGSYDNELTPGLVDFTIFANRGQTQIIQGDFGEMIISRDMTLATKQRTEGYLAHKWGTTAKLEADHPYKELAPRKLWTPAMRATDLWLDADDASTITEAANLVSQWDDKSGNSNNVFQAVGSKQPLTNSTSMSGKNTVAFDSSTFESMETAGNLFGATVNDAHVFQVFKTGSTLVNSANFSLSGSSVVANFWHGIIWSDNMNYFDNGGSGGANRINTGTIYATDEENFSSWYGTTTENKQEIWKNGTLEASDGSGHAVSTTGNIQIGNYGTIGFQNFELGEMVVINGTMSAFERQQMEGYIAWKWGKQGDLPGGHPYEFSAPTI
ncbi:MAG: LamG domain-containing protein [Nitrosomonadaceae bacterium]